MLQGKRGLGRLWLTSQTLGLVSGNLKNKLSTEYYNKITIQIYIRIGSLTLKGFIYSSVALSQRKIEKNLKNKMAKNTLSILFELSE